MGIWITVKCGACGQEHRLGHCVLERREAQRGAWHARASRGSDGAGKPAGHSGVTASRASDILVTMPTPVYSRCPDCQRMHAAGECRLSKRGLGEVHPTAQAVMAVASSVKLDALPQPVAARVKAARQVAAAVDGATLTLPAGLTALVTQWAGEADPVAWVEMAARAYARAPMTPAERQRARRERLARQQGAGDAG